MKHALVTKRMLRYEDQVRLARDSRPQREMPRVPAHHFNNLHPTVRTRRCTRTLDHFRNIAQRSVKPECVVSEREILVDRLRHANDANSALGQLRSHTHRVFTAANNECLEFQPLDILDDLLRTILHRAFCAHLLERIRARRAEIRATIAIPTAHLLAVEWQHFRRRIDQTAPTIEKTDNLKSEF